MKTGPKESLNILAIGHEASLTGAPLLLLSFIEEVVKISSLISIRSVIVSAGELEDKYSAACSSFTPAKAEELWHEENKRTAEILKHLPWKRVFSFIIRKLRKKPLQTLQPGFSLKQEWLRGGPIPDIIYVNTIASITELRNIKSILPCDIPVVIHVHEMDSLLLQYQNSSNIKEDLMRAAAIISPSATVSQSLQKRLSIPPEKIKLIPEWLCRPVDTDRYKIKYRLSIRNELGLAKDDVLCLSIGTPQWRKGSDLIPLIAKACASSAREIHFSWVGSASDDEYIQRKTDIEKLGLKARVHLINQTSDPYPFLAAADIFLLPSREDPLPVSMLEAASFGIPIICFDQSGGTADFVKSGAGLSVPYLNVQEMASSIIRLSQNLETRQTMGDKGKSLVSMSHTAQSSIPQILDVLKNVALYRQTDSPNL